MSNERFVLRPGALVVGPDESLGWIDALLAIPGSRQISGFVLSEGPLFDRGIRVPIEAVERTEDRRVHVWLTAAQLNDLADIQARRFAESTAPPEDRIEPAGGSPTVMARRVARPGHRRSNLRPCDPPGHPSRRCTRPRSHRADDVGPRAHGRSNRARRDPPTVGVATGVSSR